MPKYKWIAYTPNSTVCRALGIKIHAQFNTISQAVKFLKTLNTQAYITPLYAK